MRFIGSLVDFDIGAAPITSEPGRRRVDNVADVDIP